MANVYRNLTDVRLTARPNMVLIDPKGEIYAAAQKFNERQQTYRLVQIDFTNPATSVR